MSNLHEDRQTESNFSFQMNRCQAADWRHLRSYSVMSLTFQQTFQPVFSKRALKFNPDIVVLIVAVHLWCSSFQRNFCWRITYVKRCTKYGQKYCQFQLIFGGYWMSNRTNWLALSKQWKFYFVHISFTIVNTLWTGDADLRF